MPNMHKTRREVLASTVATTGFLAGCSTRSNKSTPTGTDTTATTTPAQTTDEATSEPTTKTETSSTLYVGPHGDDSNPGTRNEPFETIQRAVKTSQPGTTIHVLPGEYLQDIKIPSQKGGEPGKPLEITGPPDAVIKGADTREDGIVLFNVASHVHITGCTFDGLWRPSQPENPDSYRDFLIWTRSKTSEYLTDIKIKPHGVGNTKYSCVNFNMTNNVEVGEFKVIGPAGADYVHGDSIDHEGEIVYIGSPSVEARNLQEDGILTGADTCHNYHVHHIDNSRGHHHSEIVNTKNGTYDITVEYCTDGGGGYVTDQATNASIAIAGHDTTVRWNDLRGGELPGEAQLPTHGVSIDADVPEYCKTENGEQQCVGFNNSIYGNRISGYDDTGKGMQGRAVFFEAYWMEKIGQKPAPNAWPEDQNHICGNQVSGPTHANPEQSCSDSLPEGDGIGHLGGDSPWSG